MVSFVLLSAWLATAIFSRTAVEFKDFSSSLLNLFVLLTTANNPVVWASTYEANRLAFFFFFTYLVLGLFFLMNLAFSVIYSNYKAQVYKHLHSITVSNFVKLLKRFWLSCNVPFISGAPLAFLGYDLITYEIDLHQRVGLKVYLLMESFGVFCTM